jgi:hypothetical protein
LQGRWHQADGGKHRGAPTHPVFHREGGDKPVLLGEVVELRPLPGDGHRMLAEIEAGGGKSGLRLEHAIAGFRGAAGFGDNQHEGFGQPGFGEFGEHSVDARRIGVIEKIQGQLRPLTQRLGHQLRT